MCLRAQSVGHNYMDLLDSHLVQIYTFLPTYHTTACTALIEHIHIYTCVAPAVSARPSTFYVFFFSLFMQRVAQFSALLSESFSISNHNTTMPLPLLIRRALYSLILIVLAAFLSGHRTLTDPIHFSRPRCLPYFLDLLLLQAHLWHQNNPNQLNLWPHIATSICICVYEVRINALTNWKFKFNRKFVAYFSVHSTTYLLTDSLEI